MFLVTAIFNSDCLNDILTDLTDSGVEGVTITHVTGKGGLGIKMDDGTTRLYKNVRIDIIVSTEAFKELAQEAIRANTRDLETGSGKMWVTPVLEVERLRTGEKDKDALEYSKLPKTKRLYGNFHTAVDTSAS
jgi:nitrogen regulatory protein PII